MSLPLNVQFGSIFSLASHLSARFHNPTQPFLLFSFSLSLSLFYLFTLSELWQVLTRCRVLLFYFIVAFWRGGFSGLFTLLFLMVSHFLCNKSPFTRFFFIHGYHTLDNHFIYWGGLTGNSAVFFFLMLCLSHFLPVCSYLILLSLSLFTQLSSKAFSFFLFSLTTLLFSFGFWVLFFVLLKKNYS